MKHLDPRVRLGWIMVLMILCFRLPDSRGQTLLLGGIILLMGLNRISVRRVLQRVRYLFFFLPLTFLVHLLVTGRGWQLLTGVRSWNPALLEQPLVFTLRLTCLIVLMGFALEWLKPIEWLDALYHLLKPFRRWERGVDRLFLPVFIALKFFPILKEEYSRLDEGWFALGIGRKTGLSDRIRRARQSLIPLMIFSFRRAEILADALLVRSCSGQTTRSYYQPLRFRGRDWFGCAAAVSVLILTLKWI